MRFKTSNNLKTTGQILMLRMNVVSFAGKPMSEHCSGKLENE